MTQHTETAAPKRWYFLGSTPYVKAADHDRIVAALRLELSAERDAVAQYTGERNGLQTKLDEAKRNLAFEIQRKDEDTECFRAQIRIADEQCDTLRTQLAQANGWLKHYELSVPEQHKALREQLAQAQIDAEKYRQSQIGWKSSNSAEGEPG